ncbi:phage minor head protein [Salinarimonas sp. NSM]|uniref:phage minor head protein n=1 Tax=Salinarimonas sp. NSM TaxID=3458003 RepID=UPI0040361C3A
MARRPSRFNRIRAALDGFEPQVRDAFLAAIQGITAAAQVARIEERIRAGDLEGALRAVGIAASAFAGFEAAIVAAYGAGGTAAVEMLPRAAARDVDGVLIRFDARNLRAETWVREHSSTLITRVVNDQRAAVRVVLDDGLNAGRNPRATALDIVGRVDRRTGRREGGIVGLTEAQARYVVNARAELSSGDPARMRAFLERERRDRRFDRTIMRAINEGRPLSPADVDRITGRYSDSLLQLRGETIGRTETLTAVHAAQDEALRQVVDRGQVRADAVTREWRATSGPRTRDSHRAMNGQRVGLDGVFVTPAGHRLRYPGDTSLGAPASETIQCRCTIMQDIDFLAGVT